MTGKYIRGVVTALGLAAALALAACVDEQPYPVYSHGVAYYPSPTRTTYYAPSGTTYYVPPCTNCTTSGPSGNWYRYHDGQWHVD
jgi:hypothetical protein